MRLMRPVGGVAFALLLVAVVLFGGRVDALAQAVAGISIVVLVGHLFAALGRTEGLAFAICCLAVTFTLENIGVLTGFPFGRYRFLVAPWLLRIGVVPLIVGVLYLGMGYAAWVIASLILGAAPARPTSLAQLLATPVAAAFAMVQWDVVMDPAGSTLGQAWAWLDSGGYFGVPLTNFLGWLLINYLFLQAFALFQYRRRGALAAPEASKASKAFWAVPVLLFLAAGLSHVATLLDAPQTLVDAGGRVWRAADLRETAAIVMMATMLPTSLLALYNLLKSG